MSLSPITTSLWFSNGEAVEAANFWMTIFDTAPPSPSGEPHPKCELTHMHYYTENNAVCGQTPGEVMLVAFTLRGQRFVALNGGPQFDLSTGGISFQIDCDTQEQVDHFWDKLREGGPEANQVCGWLKDKYGVVWQVVPHDLKKWLIEEKGSKVVKMMQGMKKLEIKPLRKAFEEE
ncbi:hypothetical protein MKZ38_007765 [Zalerion maritima]|uniref:PhnB-like domain-containing protein n=1 Tax=Zalerion maritima TaxID=339359 RepID=A0AAD5WVU7_9PEZI|nr:hypothetical protein MKZ38_007765 [Zalerion maritima]